MRVDLEKALEASGAILRGHFILTSGRHSDLYIEKFRILEQPAILSEVCAEIASQYQDSAIEIVIGPTTGGIIVAFEVARQLGCKALYIETEDGERRLRRGASLKPGAKVLIVDDVLTTGLSIREVVEAVEQFEPVIAGIGVLIDRSELELDFGCRLSSAVRIPARSWAESELPEHLRKLPALKPGTRK